MVRQNKEMRIGFFFGGGFDRPSPARHLEIALIQGVLNSGSKAHLICSVQTDGVHAIPDDFLENDSFSFSVQRRRPVDPSNFVQRYLNGVIYAFNCRKHLKALEGCDVVFVQSSPTVLWNILAIRSVNKTIPIVYNVQDVFPGSSIASGAMKNRLLQNIFRCLQRVAYAKADCITVINEDMKRKLVEQGVPDEKISIVVNWYDESAVREVAWDNNRFVRKYNLSRDMFYVQYAGTTGYVFDYEAFLYVAQAFQKEKSVRFQLIARGSQFDLIQRLAAERHIDNIDFLPIEPQEMVSDVYSACTVCFIPLKKGIIGNSVPSKASLLMACGRPVVNSVDPDSYYYEEFPKNKIGISASCENYFESVEAIKYLLDNPSEREKMGQEAKKYCLQRYTSKNNVDLYLGIFSKLASRSLEENKDEQYGQI